MTIGTNIKRLRRERNITQDRLAEALGITSRAVSQWETGKTSPDLSVIPSLCHIFGVSSDELLGIDIEKNDEEIERLLKEAVSLAAEAKYAERTALLQEINKKYPRNYKVMQRLADSLFMEQCVVKDSRDCSEVIALCRRILGECTDSSIRHRATHTLGSAYEREGMKEELKQLVEEMPSVEDSREHFMVYRIRNLSELPEHLEYISYLLLDLFPSIATLCGYRREDGEMLYGKEDRKRLHKLSVDLVELLFPDGDYGYFASEGVMGAGFLISELLSEGDDDALWYWLEKRADFAIHTDTYDDAPHTSPILRGHRDGKCMLTPFGNTSNALLHRLTTAEEYERLRENPRFGLLTERLAKVARKPGE